MKELLPVEAVGLGKVYRLGFLLNRRVRALQDLTLEVRPGECFGLLGPNGAGKSTTIKILMNLVYPTTGQARIFGSAPNDPVGRRQVGFLPENPAPYEYLTGREFVRLAGHLAGLSGHALDTRVNEVLGMVDMQRSAGIQIRRYSKGMIQRIALAQAIVHRPKLLILDEPTSGLDPLGRRQMRDLILAERSRGTTVLFCTHIIPDAEVLCDRIAVLAGSRLVKQGSVAELLTPAVRSVELTVAGITTARLQQLVPGVAITEEEERLRFRASEADAQAVLPALINAGGRLLQLQPVRISLEELFLQAVREAGQQVGGQLS